MNLAEELYDIYGTWHVPFWQAPWFFWTCISAISLIIICLSTIIFFLWIKKKNRLSSWDQACAYLYQLKQKTVTTTQESHEAYCALSDILKKYFTFRYAINAESMTDEELLSHLKKVSFPLAELSDLSSILSGALEVKFAGAHALQEKFHHDIEKSVYIIKQTIPMEVGNQK